MRVEEVTHKTLVNDNSDNAANNNKTIIMKQLQCSHSSYYMQSSVLVDLHTAHSISASQSWKPCSINYGENVSRVTWSA